MDACTCLHAPLGDGKTVECCRHLGRTTPVPCGCRGSCFIAIALLASAALWVSSLPSRTGSCCSPTPPQRALAAPALTRTTRCYTFVYVFNLCDCLRLRGTDLFSSILGHGLMFVNIVLEFVVVFHRLCVSEAQNHACSHRSVCYTCFIFQLCVPVVLFLNPVCVRHVHHVAAAAQP